MKTQLSAFAISVMIIATAATPVSNTLPETKGTVKVKKAQPTSFAFFRTHRQGKGITGTWGVTSNDGVTCFTMVRTYEDPTDPYAVWETVCNKSCNSSRSYKHTDENVYPGYVSYCVVAEMNDGSIVPSEISTVRVVAH